MRKSITALLLASVLLLGACGTGEEKLKEGKNAGEKTEQQHNNPEQSVKRPGEADGYFPQLTTKVADNERLVEMVTSMGHIKIKLFPEQAPKAVENFITHSKNGYYDGVLFHRVIDEFMIQGGDPTGTGRGGESIYGQPFEDEFSKNLFNLRGALSMANAGPNTNGSQFFIVQNSSLHPKAKDAIKDYPEEIREAYEKGGTPWLDFKHTVFGQVTEGMDIVDKIAAVSVNEKGKPDEDVKIKKVKILK
ncbi:peptidylprolyl isomerase [Mesobacillus zeae]|uniref:Peptidyl-prolyl cis-trans isomerase n=1 Tax=Mesobacillus zeae TaxID=1917180 RepID=A0A398BGR8_9BACI|nr:peptidylprolyl isomerase [Mesobacillus zeae]RID88844.1 peptidylprolyl isomerase [Mesobacillus zeae]